MADVPPPSPAGNFAPTPLLSWLIVIASPTVSNPPGTLFRLRGGDTIGRHEDNDIVLADTAVSGYHAQIFVRDTQGPAEVVLRDMGSANGITVNGSPRAEHALNDGDRIVFGETQFVFRQVR